MQAPRKEILLVCREWKTRILVRAQLIEEGFELTALDDLDEAAALLRRRLRKPDLMIYDTAGGELNDETVEKLKELASLTKVILCVSAYEKTRYDFPDPLLVLARPFPISQIVAKAKEMVGS